MKCGDGFAEEVIEVSDMAYDERLCLSIHSCALENLRKGPLI